MMIALSLAALAAAAGTIVADAKGDFRLVYVLKPAAMAAIIALALLRSPGASARYAAFIVAGLGASLAGDVFMMLRRKRFLEGMTAFLLAHGLYIAAFLSVMSPRIGLGTALPLLIYAVLAMRLLIPKAGGLKVPIVVYVLAITVMAILAAERFIAQGGAAALCGFAGALLFVVSDSALAFNRFVKKLPAAQPIILSTYFVAQYLFALSI